MRFEEDLDPEADSILDRCLVMRVFLFKLSQSNDNEAASNAPL